MAMRTKVIGPISAYAIAVANGYTGTEAEFAEQIANAATNAQTAQTAAETAQGLVESLPSDFETTQENFAPLYADLTFPVKKGQHCIYGGIYYEANTDIASSEAWTAAHWTKRNVGAEVSDLKSAFDEKVNDKYTTINPTNWYNKDGFTLGILKANETVEESSSYKYTNYYIPVSPGDVIRFNRGDNFNGLYFRHIAAYDSNKNPLGSTYGSDASIMTFTIPSGVSYVRVTVDVLNNMEALKPMITIGSSAPSSYSAYFAPYYQIAEDFLTPESIAIIEEAEEKLPAVDDLNAMKTDIAAYHDSKNLYDGVKIPGYIAADGTENASTDYFHTNKIDVHDLIGETLKVWKNGVQSNIRFVTVYDSDNTVQSSLGSNTLGTSFTIPSGSYYVVLSFGYNQFDSGYILITTGIETLPVPTYKTWAVKKFAPVDGALNVPEPLVLSADSLADGKSLVDWYPNSIKNRGSYALYCKVGTMTADKYIEIGKNGSGGYAVGVSGTQWGWFVNNVLQGGSTHGLTIKDYLLITVDKTSEGAVLHIYTNGGHYTRTNTSWVDNHGALYVKNGSGAAITDVKCTWGCEDFRNRIWVFGDSYISYATTRWPYYIAQWNYSKNVLYSGYPGEDAKTGYEDFLSALQYGIPSIAIWAYGMNNPDSGAINSAWKTYTEMFLQVCGMYDITPILATIPCVPNYDNSYKNAWVRASGYRYIDFASAVNTVQDATTWYDNMLSTDNVHPDVQGAIALASQVLVDVPEILDR